MKKIIAVLVLAIMLGVVYLLICKGPCRISIPTLSKGTTLNIWRDKGRAQDENALRMTIDRFKGENPDIEIKVENFSGTSGTENEKQIANSISVENAPDLIEFQCQYLDEFASSNIIQPIDAIFTNEDMDDFIPSAVKQGMYNDKLYALTPVEYGLALYYNKKIFADKNVQPAFSVDEAWDWNKFFEASKKLADDNTAAIDMRLTESDLSWFPFAYLPFVMSNITSGIFGNGDSVDLNLTSPDAIAALNLFQSIFLNKLSKVNMEPNSFENGKAAMTFDLTSAFSKYASALGESFSVMPLPYLKRRVTPIASWCWGISSNTKNFEGSMKFLQMVLGSESELMKDAPKGFGVPSRKSVIDKIPEYNAAPLNIFKDELIKFGQTLPAFPDYDNFASEFAKGIKNIASGESVTSNAKAMADAMK